MYSYGLGGGQPTKHNLLWQDRRNRNVPAQQQQNGNWWNKVKRSVSTTTEPSQLTPTKVFSSDKGMLGGKGALNVPERRQEPQLFSLDNVDEGPTRPLLNLGDITSHFSPPPSQQTIHIQPPDSPLKSTPERTPTPSSDSEETSHFLIPSVQSAERYVPIKLPDLVTASETEIIKPPSPFMDLSRRRPPPVPIEIPRTRLRMTEQTFEGQERRNIVKETVSLFEKKSPVILRRKISPEQIGIIVKIPNKAVNARQRSRGPSRTPSEPDLSRQVTPTATETRDISDRLSKSYEFVEKTDTSFSRDVSFSDATSLDSRLDVTRPQVKKKISVIRSFIKATRSKISLDADPLEKEKSNTEPSRRRLRRSSSINPVKSEVQITNKSTDSVQTNSNRSKLGKKRKPSNLELKQGFNVKGFDNFMMY